MWFWTGWVAFVFVQSIVIAIWFLDSVRAVNMMSIEALMLACGAGFQATLGMRKADPEDPL